MGIEKNAKKIGDDLKTEGNVKGKLTPVDTKVDAADVKEAGKESKEELKETAKELKESASGTYTQDETESIAGMSAHSAATHVANALKYKNAENHIASKELKAVRKEVTEKKSKVREASSASIKGAVEKAVVKSLSPVKPPYDFMDSWASSSSSLNNKVFNHVYAK